MLIRQRRGLPRRQRTLLPVWLLRQPLLLCVGSSGVVSWHWSQRLLLEGDPSLPMCQRAAHLLQVKRLLLLLLLPSAGRV